MATQVITTDVTANRQNYIGGSDIAAIMGKSRWKTPLKLWLEKVQKIEPQVSNPEAVEMGIKLEQFVADLFTEKTGKLVRRAPKAYVHPDYPYMVAHIDRLVTGTDELLECKTTSAYRKDEWEGEDIPQEYILQVMWYLGITGRKVGYIAVLIGGQNFKYKRIEFDQELFNIMVNAAKEFWDKVQNNIAPAVSADDDDTLKDLYGSHSDIIIDLFPQDEKSEAATIDFEEKIAYLQEIKAHIAELDNEKKEIEASIKDIIKDNLGIRTPKYLVTWKSQRKSQIDAHALVENEPNIYAKYEKVTTYRVMRITKNEESEVA